MKFTINMALMLVIVVVLLVHLSQGSRLLQESDNKSNTNDWFSTFIENLLPNITGAIIFGVLIALCNVAGIGGGGINVSVCIILLGLTAKQSLAISSFCIFTGAFVRFLLNFKEKHPFREATSIDYTIVMMMFPMFLLGTMIGTKISIAVPDVFLLAFTTIVLALLSIHTTITAAKLRRKEIDAHGEAPRRFTIGEMPSFKRSARSRIQTPKANGDDEEVHDHEHNMNVLFLNKRSITSDILSNESLFIQEQIEKSNKLERIIKGENTHFKPFCLIVVIIISLVNLRVIINILHTNFLPNFSKGSAKMHSPLGVEPCSAVDITLFVILTLFLILMTTICILYVNDEYG